MAGVLEGGCEGLFLVIPTSPTELTLFYIHNWAVVSTLFTFEHRADSGPVVVARQQVEPPPVSCARQQP